jgi:transcriptional regulator with XRE-family HTH domain
MGERIRVLREREGLTRKELASAMSALGVTTSAGALGRFERWGSEPKAKSRQPKWVHLWAISHVLNCGVTELGATPEDYSELALTLKRVPLRVKPPAIPSSLRSVPSKSYGRRLSDYVQPPLADVAR